MIRRYLARRRALAKQRWAVRWNRDATPKQRRIADYYRVRKQLERQRECFFNLGQQEAYDGCIRQLIANSSSWIRPYGPRR